MPARGADLRFTSSSAVFHERGGPQAKRLAQTFPGITVYGAAKIAAEARIDAAIVRLPSLHDPDGPDPSDLCERILSASRDLGALAAGLTFPATDVHAATFFAGLAPGNGTSIYNLMADEPVTARDIDMAILSPDTWPSRAPLPPAMRDLIAADPDILHTEAIFDTEAAAAAWRVAGLGPRTGLGEPRRLSHQSEPAFTW